MNHRIRIALASVVLAAGCKDKPAAPKPIGPVDAAGVIDTAEEFDSVAEQHVAIAFGGRRKVPELPLLSKDGATAAVDISIAPEETHFASYEVGFLDLKGTMATAVVLGLDEAVALETDEGTKPTAAALAAAAAVLARRLAGGGFTGFDTPIANEPDSTSIPLGTVGTLEVKHPPENKTPDLPGTGSVTLRLVDARRTPVAREIIKPIKGNADDPGSCGAEPQLGQVWFDARRRRVLIHVSYVTGGESCKGYPGAYRLWEL